MNLSNIFESEKFRNKSIPFILNVIALIFIYSFSYIYYLNQPNMKYQKLGEDLEIPARDGFPLKNMVDIKFNYYLSSRINGNLMDLDITSKLFDKDKMYIRKSCYRVNLGEMENCVKANTIDHMLSLGLKESNIPASLKNTNISNTNLKLSNKGAFSD